MTNFSVKNYASERLKKFVFERSEFKFFSERVVFELKNSVSVRDSFFA